MNIRVTSSLTPEDENAIAPAILKTISGLLDLLPIAYVVRVDTSDAQVYQLSGSGGHSRAAISDGAARASDIFVNAK